MSKAEIGGLTNCATLDKPQLLGGLESGQFTKILRQELHTCEQKCDQAYLLLDEARDQLRLAHQLIQSQENSSKLLAERVAKLEAELQTKSQQLIQANLDNKDIRDRLKREKHNSYQLKTALERCLDSSSLHPSQAQSVHEEARELSQSVSSTIDSFLPSACLAVPFALEERISVSFGQSLPILSGTTQDLAHTILETALEVAEISTQVTEEKPKAANFSAVQLPQFPPLQRR
jgi:chromosome segregation ATPase